MQLSEILKMPEGFTPPEVTVKIEKVWDYKSGHSDKGEWSFQDIQVVGGGRLKLKGLAQFPKDREGMTVTIRAHSSAQHGLTGLKVAHEEYNGSTYDKLVITKSAKWEFTNPSQQTTPSNGNGQKRDLTYDTSPGNDVRPYKDHLQACALLAADVVGKLGFAQDAASVQACFATICIDTKNRGILLPKPNGDSQVAESEEPSGVAPWEDDGTADF